MSTLVYILIAAYLLLVAPKIVGYTPLVVLTGSMSPTYKTGSVIYYHEVEQKELKKGDVITYKLNEKDLITHRIYAINDDKTYVTKGDANNNVDPMVVKYDKIIGKVAKVYIPYVGYYVAFINTNPWVIVLVALILVSEFFLGKEEANDIDEKNKERSKGKHEKEK